MNLTSIVIIGFIVLESTNVIAMYFFPETKYANSVGVFKAYQKSKADPEVHDLVRYLVNWVAGTKIIFLLLLVVILVTSDAEGLFYTVLAMAIAVASFFWRLFPMVRKMDRERQVDPKNYSAILGVMIAAMVLVFVAAALITGNG
jgi:L-asparagine transporter-like permease